jgi:hypothetical protein
MSLSNKPRKIVDLHALDCQVVALSHFSHGAVMRISHEMSHRTIDFCGAAFYLEAV